MPSLRSAWPALAVCLLLLLAVGVPGAAARQHESISQLRKQAKQARSQLQRANRQYVRHRAELKKAIKQLHTTQRQLRKANGTLSRIRVPLARMANAQYENPTSSLSGLMGSNSPEADIRAATDIYELTSRQATLVTRATHLRNTKADLVKSANRLVSHIRSGQHSLKQEVHKLRGTTRTTVHTLVRQASSVGVSSGLDPGYGATCNPGIARAAARFPNGLIPVSYLCRLPQHGFMLRPDAAHTFYRLNAAYKKHFGRKMCVNAAYRGLSDQRRLYALKPPGYAAVPGTSNHGLGLAVDFCGGVQTEGSAEFNWLRANAGRYGWKHPAWAYSSPFEPWHWEYAKGERSTAGTYHE